MRLAWRDITAAAVAMLVGACTSTGGPQAPAALPQGALPGDAHVATCSALQQLHAEWAPVETLEAGDITVPEVEGVGPLRGVILPAHPRSPRPAGGVASVPVLEPDFEWDVVVMVGTVELQVDELADRLVASGDDVEDAGYTRVNGQTIERAVTIGNGDTATVLTLRDCGDQRWMTTRDAINPATTGECADAGRVAACKEALRLAEELALATSGGNTPIRPRLDERGDVVVRLGFQADLRGEAFPHLLHSQMTSGGWERTDPPPCEGGIDVGALCHDPDGEKELRQPAGLSYVRGGDHGPWTATWRLTEKPRPLRLVLHQ